MIEAENTGKNQVNIKKTKWFIFGIIGFVILLVCFLLISGNSGTNPDSLSENLLIDPEEQIEFSSQSLVQIRNETRASASNDPCLDCHEQSGVLQGISFDWKNSEHAEHNVSCIDCHEAEASDPDALDHNGFYMSPVVSPKDCAECHPDEVAQNDQSLHSFGAIYYEYLFDNKKLPYLESQVEGGYILVEDEEIIHAATLRGCQACHGTNMTGTSTEDFKVWPNNGIGRINPDGSKGSCSACHSRHSFSLEEARKPETCGQCHMGPDHPQIEIYMESKHGNIYSSEGDSWNWTKDDWQAGIDYRAPTCAGCHMSAAPGVPVTHDVSSRLSWELESPISKRTDNIANSLGIKFSDGSSWQEKQGRMKTVCKQCHSTTWVENYYEQADLAVKLYNEQYTSAKKIVDELYDEGLLTTKGFDEDIEFIIYEMWHHEGRRARMGAFMMGPDYVQWHGFYDMLHDRAEIEQIAAELRREAEAERSLVFLATNAPGTKILLKWDISHPAEVDHYEIYWDTSIITDTTSKSPNANTKEDHLTVENLTKDTVYYFTIVAVDNEGNSTAMAFSSAMPTELSVSTEDAGDDDTGALLPTTTIGLLALLIIIVFVIIILAARMKSKALAEADEPLKSEEPLDKDFEKPKKKKSTTKKRKK
jgi:hypothetical protein